MADDALPVAIQHELFNRAVEVPVANLLRVNAPVEVEEVVVSAGMGPAAGQCMVTPVCRVEDGVVTEVANVLISRMKRARIRCQCSVIFPDAPEHFVLTFLRDMTKFIFPPGTNQSNLVAASKLNL